MLSALCGQAWEAEDTVRKDAAEEGAGSGLALCSLGKDLAGWLLFAQIFRSGGSALPS